jgi:hypothetical protein
LCEDFRVTVTDTDTAAAEVEASATWERTVAAGRDANRQALEGRFLLTLASYEAFPPHGKGMIFTHVHTDRTTTRAGLEIIDDTLGRPRKARLSLIDWCEEVGVNYHTLNSYRQLVSWWYESDPVGLRGEIGIPEHIEWHALKFARQHWLLAADFRQVLADSEGPANGRVFTTVQVEYLARMDEAEEKIRRKRQRSRTSEERFDSAVSEVRKTMKGLARVHTTLQDGVLDDEQRAILLEHAREAQEVVNGLVRELIVTPVAEPDAAAA